MQTNSERAVIGETSGRAVTDGAGVKLTRLIGVGAFDSLDPFLLLDVFESDRPDDYLAGFPSHPHRGFETVTYLLAGQMRHKDSAGNEGVIRPGGVQWMTAGSGIVHSEMPEQIDGLLQGFQLWVNLPRSRKMTAPAYQEFPPERIPVESRPSGTTVRVVCGATEKGTQGPVENADTDPLFMDVRLTAGDTFRQRLPERHNAFVYVIDGKITIGGRDIGERRLGVLGEGPTFSAKANADSRFLLVAGRPLNEPVVRAGPFVMNTREEILQAFRDFRTL